MILQVGFHSSNKTDLMSLQQDYRGCFSSQSLLKWITKHHEKGGRIITFLSRWHFFEVRSEFSKPFFFRVGNDVGTIDDFNTGDFPVELGSYIQIAFIPFSHDSVHSRFYTYSEAFS